MKVGVLLCARQRHLDEPAILSFFLVNEHGKSIYVLLQYTAEIRRGLLGRQAEQPKTSPVKIYAVRKKERERRGDGGERSGGTRGDGREKVARSPKTKAGRMRVCIRGTPLLTTPGPGTN